MYVPALEIGVTREKALIVIQMLRCADGVWTACWGDVMAQMVAAPMPMLHLSGGSPRGVDCRWCRTCGPIYVMTNECCR